MFPVITGATGSERIYDGYPDVALDMIDSRTFDGRIQLVEYRPAYWTTHLWPGPNPRRASPTRPCSCVGAARRVAALEVGSAGERQLAACASAPLDESAGHCPTGTGRSNSMCQSRT